jgi:hypothetical protein
MTQPHLQAVSDRKFTGDPDTPPSVPTADSTSGSPTGAPPEDTNSAAAVKQRAEQPLPTDRLSFDKQIQSLRAIAQLSGTNRRPVNAEAQSATLGVKGNVGGLSNRFFKDSGWLESAGRGSYVPAEPLIRFHRHLAIQPDDLAGARAILAEPAKSSWYWREVGDMFDGEGVPQSGVLHALADAAGAAPNHTAQLILIIEWLIWLGLIARNGENLVRVGGATTTAVEPAVVMEEGHAAVAGTDLPEDAAPETSDHDEPTAPQPVATLVDTGAMLSFNFSVRITADDAAKLDPEQLQTLLAFAEKLRG